MKKLLSLILALSMLLCLCACGSTAQRPPLPDKDAEVPEETVEPTIEVVEEYEPGSTDGNSYINESLGIGIDFNSDWYVYTEAEMLEMVGIVADSFEDEGVRDLINSSGTFYELLAKRVDGNTFTSSINIATEYVGERYKTMTTEDYVNIAVPQLQQQLPAAGITIESLETGTAEFAGQEESTILLHVNMNGVSFVELMFALKCGEYFMSVTIAGIDEASAYALADMFYAL